MNKTNKTNKLVPSSSSLPLGNLPDHVIVNDKIKHYLLGGNDNLMGTVLAIRKNLKKTNFDKYMQDIKLEPNSKHYMPEGYAVMLYFDHRLARVVRHLFNPNLTFWGKSPEIIDLSMGQYKNDYKTLAKIKTNPYKYNYDPKLQGEAPLIPFNILDVQQNLPFLDLTPKTLTDGKINSRMKYIFFHHLFHDFYGRSKVYDITDFKVIQENIEPTGYVQDENGDIKGLIDTKLTIDSQIKELNVSPLIGYPLKGNIKEIYLPKGVSFKQQNQLEGIGFRFTNKLIEESPQVIQDLKSVINVNTIQNSKNLINKISKFNEALQLKIAKLSKAN